MENLILIDWVSITYKYLKVGEVKRLLGLENVPWELTTGARGYRKREYYGGVSLHFDPSEKQPYKVWLEMSGQGCRTFESFGAGNFEQLLSMAQTEDGVHITRLDVAFDDHTGLIDINEVARKIKYQEYTALASWWKVEISSDGLSCYVGSPRSDLRIRIYDKAAERGATDEHWVRIELQLRDAHALGFTQNRAPLGETFRGVLRKYLVFREPNLNDSHKYRWEISPWYEALLDGVEKISVLSQPGVEYNLARCEHFVFEQAGNAIDAWIKCYGAEAFFDRLHSRDVKPNLKYEKLVAEFHGLVKSIISKEYL